MSQQRVSPVQQPAVPHFDLNRTFTAVHMALLLGLGGVSMGVTAAQTVEQAEVEKFLWADVVIYQMPGWWMGAPWTVKKYIDEVFTAGHGSLYANDGRTRSDASQKYGSGGLVQGKQYMLSLTWNAPQQAFDDPSDFFEGKGVDAVYFPFHKANQFLGMSGLPTFLAVDVMKRPDVPAALAAYEQHLDEVFGKGH
ncbi:MAG: NAD(P)H-dependent oxidoreductase [Pseudomonas sp.]|nr:NAD(P)H-dependent oxidoreductase [Pseudomonas sp.]